MAASKPTSAGQYSFLQTMFFILASLLMLGYLLVIGQSILIPFVIALFFWYLINALGREIYNRTSLGRRVATAVALLLVFGGITAFVQVTKGNIQTFIEQAPVYQQNINIFIDKFTDNYTPINLEGLQDLLKKMNFGGLAAGIVGAVGSIATMTVTILIYLVFMFLEQASFRWKLNAFFKSEEKKNHAEETLKEIGRSLERYVGLKSLASLAMGVCGFIVLSLLGVDNAVFWALIFGLLNFIPYIGPFIGTALPLLATLVQFGDLGTPLMVLAALGGIAFIIGNLIEPRLFGNSLNLSPLVILISLATWGSLWGVIGMILCVPMMVSLMIIFYQFDKTRPVAILMSEKEKC